MYKRKQIEYAKEKRYGGRSSLDRPGRNSMRKAIAIQCALLLLVLAVTVVLGVTHAQKRDVIDGWADFSQSTITDDFATSLDGDWEFYWGQALTPEDFDSLPHTGTVTHVPALWNFGVAPEYPRVGVATYRARIRIASTDKELAVFVPRIFSEYELLFNGEFVGGSGMNSGVSAHYMSPQVYQFMPQSNVVELILQVKNTVHSNAGISQSIRIGTEDRIDRDRLIAICGDVFIITLTAVSAFYHITLYLVRRKEKMLLWFGLLSLVVSIRSSFLNQTTVMLAFPNLPMDLGIRLAVLLMILLSILLFLFLQAMFPNDFPRKVMLLMQIPNMIFFPVVAFAPVSISLSFVNSYIIYSTACSLIMIYLATVTLARHDRAAIFFEIGTFLFLFGSLYEILVYYQIVDAQNPLSMGLAGFALVQAVHLAFSYSRIEREQIVLNQRLRITNLAYLRAQIGPHFLFNALSTISNEISQSPETAKELLLDFSDYLRGRFSPTREDGLIPLSEELDTVFAYLSLQKARYRERLQIEYELDADGRDLIPAFSVQPLVENAVAHGILPKEEGGTVKVKSWQDEKNVHIVVEDDGVGIARQKETSDLEIKGNGIGIKNINQRLELLFGRSLQITSAPGEGTRIEMIVPLED